MFREIPSQVTPVCGAFFGLDYKGKPWRITPAMEEKPFTYDDLVSTPQDATMMPISSIFSPLLLYGTGLTPQPVQNIDIISLLEDHLWQQGDEVSEVSMHTPEQNHSRMVTPASPRPKNNPWLSLMSPVSLTTSDVEGFGIFPQLQNVVSTVNLGCQLDLTTIAQKGRNVEYNPKRFASVTMRMRQPRATTLIFRTGKIVCTGAKSEEQSHLATRRCARIVQKLGFPVRFLDFKIRNIVGNCNVRFPIQLEDLAVAHQQLVNYEPELFPGLTYRMIKPRVDLLIFASGNIVLTGAKVRAEMYEAFVNIYPILKTFKSIT